MFGFHDCTIIATCRPGGGPTVDGGRNDNLIQQSFYNGWKKHHGIKFQTLELPNGLCADLHGPSSFRHNDLELLHNSNLNTRLEQAQANQARMFASYGDGIYPIDTCTISKHVIDYNNMDNQTIHSLSYENRMMSRIRIANEWDYGSTCSMYPFIKNKYGLKIRKKGSNASVYFVVGTILRNAHMCLYEGISASYFDCSAPSLEEYFHVANEH